MEKVIIIGSGPAGYTAAIYLARAGLQPLVFEGPESGGQLTTTSEIENFPGFPAGVLGSELMKNMRAQAERFGARVLSRTVTKVDLSVQPYKVFAGETVHETKTVIVSTGASARRLGLESEKALYGKGVSACATCDGFFFRGKEVVVVGGGDAALEEATFLTKFANKVTVVHMLEELNASKFMQEKARGNSKVSFILNTEVVEVLGVEAGHVTGVRLRNRATGTVSEFKCDGLFAAIGRVPNTALFKEWLETDEAGFIKTKPDSSETNRPGVFAAGDVRDRRYRQAVTAAGSGCMASLDAERFLSAQE